jgi:hypothetical protein
MAQSGFDHSYQERLKTNAKTPYFTSEGRLLYVIDRFSTLFGTGGHGSVTLHCSDENQELWQYELTATTILSEYQIAEKPDGTIIVTYFDFGPCNNFREPDLVWLHLSANGTLINQYKQPVTAITNTGSGFIMRYIIDTKRSALLLLLFSNTDLKLWRMRIGDNPTLEQVSDFTVNMQTEFASEVLIDTTQENTILIPSNVALYKIVDDTIQSIQPYGFQFFPIDITVAPDGSTVTASSFESAIVTYSLTPEGIGPLVSQTTITNSNVPMLTTLKNGELCSATRLISPFVQQIECYIWPSATALESMPMITRIELNTFVPEVLPTPDYILIAQTGQHFPIDVSGFQQITTAEVRRHSWGTGAPYLPYPDLVLESVTMAPDTWGYIYGENNENTYINCAGGGTVTVRNQSNTVVQSLVLNAFYEKEDFDDLCAADRQMCRRFDNLNLAFDQRVELPLDPFINERTPTTFSGAPDNKPAIHVWVSAPNDMPDYTPRNNGLIVTDFFSLRAAPGTFHIFPNPVSSDYMTITLVPKDLIQARFRIYNMLGQLVATPIVVNNEEYYYLPVHDLPKGIYYLTIGEESRLFMRN